MLFFKTILFSIERHCVDLIMASWSYSGSEFVFKMEVSFFRGLGICI